MKSGKTREESLSTAAEWMAQVAGGELTHVQKASFTEWMRESPRNVRDFLELVLLSKDMSALPLSHEQVDVWVREARDSSAATPSISPIASRLLPGRRRLRAWAVAASIASAALCMALFQWWQDGRYVTRLGEQRIVTLDDGSVVTLNTSSKLKVDFSDDGRALHLLEGEAFFRVARDAARPFVVTAQDATVQALGTQFNVRIARRATLVSVLDGTVEVRDRTTPVEKAGREVPTRVVRIGRGEEASVGSQGINASRRLLAMNKVERASASRAVAWTKGRVEFQDMPLIDVLREFQRYREFDVSVAEPVRQLKLTGSFDAQDPESAFAYIATLPGLVVERPSAQAFHVRKK
jgi:transmembrane sensor